MDSDLEISFGDTLYMAGVALAVVLLVLYVAPKLQRPIPADQPNQE